jgi:hypothetical protein
MPADDGWRNHYDSWKLAPGNTVYVDEDGNEHDQDELDARAEAAAEERAERQREDAEFDAPEREERVPWMD